jgi:hypothetical protein
MRFTIRGTSGLVSVEVLSRVGRDNLWDANMLATALKIEVRGFSAAFPLWIRLQELTLFRGQLEHMHKDLHGIAALHCIEPGLALHAEMFHTGGIAWTVTAQHPMGTDEESTLRSTLRNDQTYLTPLIAEIAAILDAYPMVRA